ncbi:unnamed protein product [Caenorhabditis auriculariae]|uniref:Signal recognition particle 19 kDa protein n=1 Tax=Caenorhabditis auriculariae TaxID=2777116 RepID=A0A8S1H6N0_9PELO|nr:unnamed protein product [Caenorhabditis auriculariae]
MAISSAKSESFSHEKRWVVVYPAYLDSKKSTKEGRKIPKLHAVEAPTSAEIHDVLAASGLNPLLERSKMYTRDADREPSSQGRVRVQLKNDDGTPKSLQYPTRAAFHDNQDTWLLPPRLQSPLEKRTRKRNRVAVQSSF